MADLRFFSAFLTPSGTSILGKKLKPFCLKHRIFLEGIASPFMEQDKELTPTDLIIALKICADESIDGFTLADKWKALVLTLSKKQMAEAALAFVKHINQQNSYPKFYEKKSSNGESSIPWQLSILATLIRNGISYTDALNMPESKALWMATAFNIQQGAKLDILTTDDEDLIDHLAKLEGKANNEQ
jgi:hypothetical protein